MLIQIVILAWIFLGEGITLQEIIGMAVAAVESEGNINMKDYILKNFLTEYIILRNLRYVNSVT
ncbi:MAG: hypothetical protein IH949_12350 [Bacteroidetes bacterium]|nr:hypothetical protein [Bacteroidota bacterium]